MVSLRHMPPAQVLVLNNSAFDSMTRSAFIAWTPAEPKQSTTIETPEGLRIRQAVAIRRETEGDNRSDFAAGTQAGESPSTAQGRRQADNRHVLQ